VSLVKAEWQARGSRKLLRDFFAATPEPPLVPLLRHLCGKLNVAPFRVTLKATGVSEEEEGGHASAFLGAGGSARVFCVKEEAGGRLHALKASTTASEEELTYEFESLQSAAAVGAPVVPVLPRSLVFFMRNNNEEYCGGGFLLKDVLRRAVLDSLTRCAAAFAALRSLHALGIVHGDARLPNLLSRKLGDGGASVEELLWIDLRSTLDNTPERRQLADARTLAASVLGKPAGTPLPASVVAALDNVPSGGVEAYQALAAAVWAAFTTA